MSILKAISNTCIATLLIAPLGIKSHAYQFQRANYNPAILSLGFTTDRGAEATPEITQPKGNGDSFVDIVLVTKSGSATGQRIRISKKELVAQLSKLYSQIARQDSLNTQDSASPARQIYDLLIRPILPELEKQNITTLLIAAERGLQGVPFAALHDGSQYFGQRYAFSLTPSLQFTSLGPPKAGLSSSLVAGASKFKDLAPLPTVPQEVSGIGVDGQAVRKLDQEFTPNVLLEQASDSQFSRVHVATHAEFLPGGPSKSKLYTGTTPLQLSDFLKLRQRRDNNLLELFSLSACRTALGDSSTEMGFAGLALQAGARSAIGTLWYIDDIATTAYFLQLYRYLDQGVPKAEALQATRIAFADGSIRLQGNQLIGVNNKPLVVNLTTQQQRRVDRGLQHPFFWSGIELLGTPW